MFKHSCMCSSTPTWMVLICAYVLEFKVTYDFIYIFLSFFFLSFSLLCILPFSCSLSTLHLFPSPCSSPLSLSIPLLPPPFSLSYLSVSLSLSLSVSLPLSLSLLLSSSLPLYSKPSMPPQWSDTWGSWGWVTSRHDYKRRRKRTTAGRRRATAKKALQIVSCIITMTTRRKPSKPLQSTPS